MHKKTVLFSFLFTALFSSLMVNVKLTPAAFRTLSLPLTSLPLHCVLLSLPFVVSFAGNFESLSNAERLLYSCSCSLSLPLSFWFFLPISLGIHNGL